MEAELSAGGIRRCVLNTAIVRRTSRQRSRVRPTDRWRFVFDAPQRAVAPGQAVVIYRGDVVLGGGTVTAALKE